MISRQFSKGLSRRSAVSWLLLGLLLLGQLSWASHFHEADELQQHSCLVCTQLHNIDQGSSGLAGLSLPAPPSPILIQTAPAPAFASPAALRPQSRAPPLS